jgi:hypothetical protein
MYQLLPHFRLRMLIALSMLLCTLLVLSAGVLVGPTLATARAFPFFALAFVVAFLVAIFLVFFLAFGDWRWFAALPLALVALVSLRAWSPATAGFLAALPAWVWSATAIGAWAIFAAWYLRVRQVRPVTLMPQHRAVELEAARPVPRAIAIRTLLASSRPPAAFQETGYRPTTPLRFLVWAVVITVLMTGLRFVSLTGVFWPLTLMLLYGERSLAIVRQSRLVWLKIPGSRDAVRVEIEKVLWRNLGFGAAILAIVAAIAASPLVGAGAARALLGLAVTAGAALYGTYVAMAAVTSVATYLWAFGPMVLLQIVLLGRAEPSLTAVAVVAGLELAGAALLRLLAIRRWRSVDWLRLRPLAMLVGGPRWM